MEIVSKITAKTFNDGIESFKKGASKQETLFRVFGVCTGVYGGMTTFGAWVGLLGEFKAVSCGKDKTEFFSNRLILPKTANDMVSEKVKLDKTDVSFAFEIGLKKSDSPVGYDYTFKPLMKPEENNRLADLEKKLIA